MVQLALRTKACLKPQKISIGSFSPIQQELTGSNVESLLEQSRRNHRYQSTGQDQEHLPIVIHHWTSDCGPRKHVWSRVLHRATPRWLFETCLPRSCKSRRMAHIGAHESDRRKGWTSGLMNHKQALVGQSAWRLVWFLHFFPCSLAIYLLSPSHMRLHSVVCLQGTHGIGQGLWAKAMYSHRANRKWALRRWCWWARLHISLNP